MHRSPHRRYRSQSIYLAALLALVLTTTTGLIVAPSRVFAAGFGSGNLVVLRIGDGSASLSSAATAVFLDEFTPTGSLAQTIALPTATSGSNARLTNSGSASSEGALSRSADGRYLTLAGYDADLGTSSIASTASASVNRVIARVEATGAVDTRTRISDGYTGNNIRGAVTNDGTGFWTGGTASGTAGGVRYVPFGNTGTSTQITNPPTNVRVPNIFNGQLYVSSGSSPYVGVSQVGTGLPTSSLQTTSLLSGLPNSGNPYAYVLLDRDGTVSGVDTLYIADQTSSIGLAKYSFDGTTWTARGTSAGVLTGLTGVVNGGSVTLYATLGTGAGNTLVSFTDSAAYNAPMSSGSFTTLATAAANTVFRGVAFAPESGSETPTAPSITTQPADQSTTTGNTATLTVTVSGSTPLSYQWYQGSVDDTSTPVGNDSASFTTPTLTATTSYWVRVTNSAGSVDSAMATVTVTAAPATCSAADTPIYTVQGSSDTSPLSGKTVTVQGAVVGDYEGASPNLRGFFLQDLNLDTDDSTSEGIFVFESNNADSVSLGQVVQVTGTVVEYQGQTEIDSPTVEDCGETASVTPTDVTLPFASANDLERFEGMLVRFPQTLYVTEHYQLGRFGQVVLSSSARLAQPTNIVAPGTAATTQQAANDLNRIIVDDAQNSQNPEQILFGRGGNLLSADNTLRGGDSASNIVGVLTYTWSGNSASGNAYRLRPINALGGGVPNFQPTNSRPSAPPTVGGNLKVASFNVLNYFLTLDSSSEALCGPLGAKQECRGAETAQELSRQQQKLNQALIKLDADVLGLIELENTQDAQGQDVNPLADIVARLNGSLGSDVYSYINTGVIGSDTIRVGIIYKKASVTPVGDPLIDTSSIHNRPPVAQLFTENASGEHFTVIVNHFKSKSSCPSDTTDLDSDQGDGQGCWNQTRVQQAQALITFINNTVVSTTTDPDVLLIGDFNSYAKEDPITTLVNAGFTNLLLRYNGSDAYSYAYDGQWGYLDQGLSSASLLPQVTGASDYHINADEPSVIDYNTNYKSTSQLTSLFN
ncbi:MAG: ExeM/NucH family extracellular endonuclease, partial [Oscillochloris sp.]|nr:ExeM/NucH family extracellular endonuclease [Oscillochloris sp.]